MADFLVQIAAPHWIVNEAELFTLDEPSAGALICGWRTIAEVADEALAARMVDLAESGFGSDATLVARVVRADDLTPADLQNATSTAATVTTATTTAAVKQLVARIVHASVLGHGTHRTLDVRIRVSEPARAQLRLLAHRSAPLKKTFSLKGGANELKARLAPKIKKGTYLDDHRRHASTIAAAGRPLAGRSR